MSCNCASSACSECTPTNSICQSCPGETAVEPLPSTLENFVLAIFGSVVRTEVDGVIVWTLPCDLDAGLPGNPRQEGEGVACYLLRLWNEGIMGLPGPQGVTGPAGPNGRHAFTITANSFTAPTLVSPQYSFTFVASPVIQEGLMVFIPTLGWSTVDTMVGTTAFLTLVEVVPTPAGVIQAGQLVLPTGPRGYSITGPQGIQGIQGVQGLQGTTGFTGIQGIQGIPGAAGAVATTNSDLFTGSLTGTDMTPLSTAYADLNFGVQDPIILLPVAGTYFISVVISFSSTTTADLLYFQLYDDTAAAAIDFTEVQQSVTANHIRQAVIHCLFVATVPSTLKIQAKNSTFARGTVYFGGTSAITIQTT